VHIQRKWASHIIRIEVERIPKIFLMENFIKQDQCANQEHDARTSSGGTHCRSYKYEGGGEEQKTEERRSLPKEARAQKGL
jgi:hypothetical protein